MARVVRFVGVIVHGASRVRAWGAAAAYRRGRGGCAQWRDIEPAPAARVAAIGRMDEDGRIALGRTHADAPHRRHRRRRHRQGSRAGRPARARGGRQALRHRLAVRAFRLELRLLRASRPHDAGGLVRHAARLRGDLLRRRRLAGDGARPRVAVGLADPVPPPLRPVRQPAALPADARRAVAARAAREPATSTSSSCARTPRASIRRSAGACSKARRRRWCSRKRCSRAAASTACRSSRSSSRARGRAAS